MVMGVTPVFFATTLVLMSLLAVIASAHYGNGPKPDIDYRNPEIQEKPVPIGVEGIILCGNTNEPIQGTVTRITCLANDDHGYEMAPFSFMSSPSDEKGYFLATLFLSQLSDGLHLTQCKAFLGETPLEETCKFPTDINDGQSGALLSSYRFLKDQNMKLYSVGPFFYSTETTSAPGPNGY